MERKETRDKQTYLRTAVIDQGFNPNDFVKHLCSIRENGSDIDSWTLEELKTQVVDFLQNADVPKDGGESTDNQKSPDLATKAARAQQRSSIFNNFDSDSESDASPRDNISPLKRDQDDTEQHGRRTQLNLAEAMKATQEVESEMNESAKEFLRQAVEEASEEQKELVVGLNKF